MTPKEHALAAAAMLGVNVTENHSIGGKPAYRVDAKYEDSFDYSCVIEAAYRDDITEDEKWTLILEKVHEAAEKRVRLGK